MSSQKKKGSGRKAPAPTPVNPVKRNILLAVRWSAWIVLLCVIITQFADQQLEDKLALGMFVIAGLLYAISLVLERKYKW